MSQLFTSGGQSIRRSNEYSGLIPLGLTGLIPLKSKGSQGSFSVPEFESISSSALSLLYGPTVTSIHDHWKNHNFDYVDLCGQSDISAF